LPIRRILLVDDDIAEISAVKRVLGRLGHQPALATNLSDALAAIAQAAPDLILVGASCENGGAPEFTHRLSGEDATRAIPVVLLGEASDAAPTASQLPRPIDPGVLAERVQELLAFALRRAAQAPTPNAAPTRVPSPAQRSPADALRARAEELRRAAAPLPAPAPAPAPTLAPALASSRAPAPAPATARAPAPAAVSRKPGPAAAAFLAELATPTPPEPPPVDLGEGLDELLRRAEAAERARAAERKARTRQADRATVEAAQRADAERLAIEKAARAREAEANARAEARARADAEQEARRAREAEEEARREAEARAQAEAVARQGEAVARQGEAEARRTVEDVRHAEAARHAAEANRRARDAAERKRLESTVRAEAERLRAELATQRKLHETELATVLERAQAEEEAAEERRRVAAEEARADGERRAEAEAAKREEAETELRRAIESARAELDTLRRRNAEESAGRAQAEAELRRMAEDGERAAAERAAFARLPEPAPDPNEEAARLRALAARDRRSGDPDRALRLDASWERPTWLEPEGRAAAAAVPAAPQPPPAPPAERDESIAPPPVELRAGKLGELPAPRLLATAARAALSGRLDFASDVARSIWFEDGRVVGATSAAPGERVDEVALRLGLLTRDQHRQVAGAAAALSTRHAARLLLDRGYLKSTELTGLVRRRTEDVLFALFADTGASFRWVAAPVPPDERIALDRGPLALAIEGIRRRWLHPQVHAVLGGPGTLLAPAANGPALAALGLSSEERRALTLADGLRTLDEVVAESPLDPLSTRQVLAALVLTGALAIRLHQAGRPAAAIATAIDLARVREKLDQVRRADYFAILGVGRHCTPHEVRDAAERLISEFDPARFPALQEDGLPGRFDEIRRVVADAREVLVDEAVREEYVRGLGL
jgi:CheY-like chemotaxis protein